MASQESPRDGCFWTPSRLVFGDLSTKSNLLEGSCFGPFWDTEKTDSNILGETNIEYQTVLKQQFQCIFFRTVQIDFQ